MLLHLERGTPPLLGANRLHNEMEWVMSYDRKVVSGWNEKIKLNWNDWKPFEDVFSSTVGLPSEHCVILGFDHLVQPLSERNDEEMISDSESWKNEIFADPKCGFSFFFNDIKIKILYWKSMIFNRKLIHVSSIPFDEDTLHYYSEIN